MRVTHEITLDLSRQGIQCSIPITQNDAGAHKVVIRLRNGACPIALEENDQAVLYIDNDIWEPTLVYTNNGAYPNSIVYHMSPNVTAEAGEHTAVLQIYKSAESITFSPRFTFTITQDITMGSRVLFSPQYAAVIKAQQAAEQYAREAEEVKDSLKEIVEGEISKVNDAVNELDARKREAINDTIEGLAVYTREGDTDGFRYATSEDIACSFIIRDDNGRAKIEAPISNADITNKKYVDDTRSEIECNAQATYIERAVAEQRYATKESPKTVGDMVHTGNASVSNAVTAGELFINGLAVVRGNAVFENDLTVLGTTIIENQETLNVENAYIVVNDKGTDIAVTMSGIVIRTGVGGYAYAVMYDPVSQSVRLGMGVYEADESNAMGRFVFTQGEGLPIAVRDGSEKINNEAILSWNASSNSIVDSQILLSELKAAVELYNTGTIVVTDANGYYEAKIPQKADQAANKKYVDDLFESIISVQALELLLEEVYS